MTRNEAQIFIDDIIKLRDLATDEQASQVAHLYPMLKKNGQHFKAGDRIYHKGQLKKLLKDIDDNDDLDEMDNTIWEELDYKEGRRKIRKDINSDYFFNQGEIGYWKGQFYRSIISNNVWNPESNPGVWELIEKEGNDDKHHHSKPNKNEG